MESGGNDININPGVHVTNMHLGNLGLQSPFGAPLGMRCQITFLL